MNAPLPKLLDDMPLDPFDGKLSVKGKQWQAPAIDTAQVESLIQRHSLPDIIARFLVLRGLDRIDIDAFLTPRLAQHFPDPFRLRNMEDAAKYLAEAIIQGKTIGILADFDVDGATSYAIMARYLKAVTGRQDIPFFIPDRLNDGYGPSVKGFQSLKDQGAEIVIVLDCGITAIDPLAAAKSMGLQTVIVDHHEPDEALPEADFIINPKLTEDTSGYDYLAAVGVTFLMAVAVNAKLRAQGYFSDRQEPKMREFLDLVALGTVCDMVPLVEANRLFVKHGFPMMAGRRNIGLNALLQVSNITTMPDPYHAGFMLGPRINAGSRVHHSDLGAQLLATEDAEEAARLAWLLDDCNKKRQEIQKSMTREAMDKAKAMMIENPSWNGLVIDGEGWHTGLSGLVAGAIKDKYGKPACVISYVETETGVIEGRASGRSIQGIHIAEIFMSAHKQGLLVKGGGHAMAGGFTILKENLEDFRQFFCDQIKGQKGSMTHSDSAYDPLDLILSVKSLTLQTADMLINRLGPFGTGHEAPSTCLTHVRIDYADQIGTNHVRCTIRDMDGSKTMKAMAFRALDTDLGKFLFQAKQSGQPVHLKGDVKINEWQGRQSVEFHITDAMTA